MSDRANLIIAATVADATRIKRSFPQFSTWQVMTPRNQTGRGWVYGKYMWTDEACELPAQTRWDLRQRLRPSIDEHSEERPFPDNVRCL